MLDLDFETAGFVERLHTVYHERRTPAPGLMELFLTRDCNLRCTYCFVGKKASLRMSREVSTQAVKFLFERSNTKSVDITFFGGEPLLELEHISQICDQAEELSKCTGIGITYNTTTNGTLLNKDTLQFLCDRRIKFLISIDGTREAHDLSRKTIHGEGTWQRIVDAIPMMKQYQPWLGARVTPTPENIGKLFDGVKTLYEHGINQFIIGPASGCRWTDDALEIYVEQILLVAELYIQKKQNEEPFRMTLFENNIDSKQGSSCGRWGCGAASGRIAVYTDGSLFGCSKIMTCSSDTPPADLCLGSVFTGFTGVKARYLHLDHTDACRYKCRVCDLQNDCEGGCLATNYAATGNILDPGADECSIARAFFRLKTEYRVLREKYGFEEKNP